MFNYKKKKLVDVLNRSFGKPKNDLSNFHQIESYFRKKDNSKEFQIISDRVCNDLDFNKLFKFIDRTCSKVGQQFLYNKLRVLPKNVNKSDQKLIEEFVNNYSFRNEIQYQLSKLNDAQAYHINSLFQDSHREKPKWFFIVPLLSFISLPLFVLSLSFHVFLYILPIILITNGVIHYWNKYNLYPYLSSIPQLLILNKVAKELTKHSILNDIQLDVLSAIRAIDKIRNRMSFFKLQVNVETGGEIVAAIIIEIFKIFVLLEPLLLFNTLNKIESTKNEIEKVFSFIGKIDSLISIASLRYGLKDYCIPGIKNKYGIVNIKDMYHPLIPNCIPNSININGKSILLTGSNMSGKTSFIRAIGINVITGLTINTCFAKQFQIPKMRILTAIRISDDLLSNKSYYFEELLTIKDMINSINDRDCSIMLLDELFKGTNTIERIAIGKAVLSYLSKTDNIVFVSTHDNELADLLKDEYELYHFTENVKNETIHFDYKLKNGRLQTRNAIKILSINKYPESVINEAISISKSPNQINPNKVKRD